MISAKKHKIRVLLVDDSPTKRDIFAALVRDESDMEIAGIAMDGKEGVEMAQKLRPDVITMDIEMPNMNGIEATKIIMSTVPTPIVIVSSLSKAQIIYTMEAMHLGAVDVVAVTEGFKKISEEFVRKVRLASKIKVVRYIESRQPGVKTQLLPVSEPSAAKPFSRSRIVVIGVSTGGPTALFEILSQLPEDFPAPVVIVQHMMGGFTEGLAEWLNSNCALSVREAKKGELLKPGSALICPGDYNLRVTSQRNVELNPVPPDALYKPSVDAMMKSVAETCRSDVVGVILTGMGKDGCEGMAAIKSNKGKTLAQDEASCIVYGMPKVAIETGCIDRISSIKKMAEAITAMLQET